MTNKRDLITEEVIGTNPYLFNYVYNKIRNRFITNIYYYYFKQKNKNINEEILKEIFYQIFDDKYSFNEFMQKINYVKSMDSAKIEYDLDNPSFESVNIYLCHLKTPYSLSSYIHEFSHARVIGNQNQDLEKVEVLPILNEIISVSMLDELLKTKYIEGEFIDVLMELKDDFRAYFLVLKMLEDSKYEKYYNTNLNNAVSDVEYILGRIYALRLFEIYKQDPKEMLKSIKEVLTGKEDITKILNDYEINIDKRKTIEPTLSLIKKYGIEI